MVPAQQLIFLKSKVECHASSIFDLLARQMCKQDNTDLLECQRLNVVPAEQLIFKAISNFQHSFTVKAADGDIAFIERSLVVFKMTNLNAIHILELFKAHLFFQRLVSLLKPLIFLSSLLCKNIIWH